MTKTSSQKQFLIAVMLIGIILVGVGLSRLQAFGPHHPWDDSGIYIACTAKERSSLNEVYLYFGPPYPDSVSFSNIHVLDEYGNNIVKYDYYSKDHCIRVGYPPIGDVYHLAIYALYTHRVGTETVTEMVWFKGSCTLEPYVPPPTEPPAEPPAETRFTLTITASEGGVTDPDVGSHTYSKGKKVTVTAIASPSYVFSYWKLDGSKLDNESPITLTINGDCELHAVFAVEGEEPPPSDGDEGLPQYWWWLFGILAAVISSILFLASGLHKKE